MMKSALLISVSHRFYLLAIRYILLALVSQAMPGAKPIANAYISPGIWFTIFRTIYFFLFLFTCLFFLKNQAVSNINFPEEKVDQFFDYTFQKDSDSPAIKVSSGYEIPDNTLPWREKYLFTRLFDFRFLYLQRQAPGINHQAYRLYKVWLFNHPSSFFQTIRLETGSIFEVQKVDTYLSSSQMRHWEASVKISLIDTNWFLTIERFGLAEFFFKNKSILEENIFSRFYQADWACFFQETAFHLYAKVFDVDQGQGKYYWGIRVYYALGRNFSLFTGYDAKTNREIIGFKIKSSAWSIGYTYKTGPHNIYGHQVEISYQLVSGKEHIEDNGKNRLIGKEKKLTTKKKMKRGSPSLPVNLNKFFYKNKKKPALFSGGAKSNYFKKNPFPRRKGKYSLYKKRPIKKPKISLTALLRKGISPARALKIFRLWSRGFKLNKITEILGITQEEQRILKQFKG